MISQRDIVLLIFPFSNLSASKVRPALVISNNQYNAKFEDLIAVAMTSNLKTRGHSILVTDEDLEEGKLIVNSKIKPDKIFSASQKLVRTKIGRIEKKVYDQVIEALLDVVRREDKETSQ